jgi:hypothetical protein
MKSSIAFGTVLLQKTQYCSSICSQMTFPDEKIKNKYKKTDHEVKSRA